MTITVGFDILYKIIFCGDFMKKISALIVSFFMIFSFVSCSRVEKENVTQESKSGIAEEITSAIFADEAETQEIQSEVSADKTEASTSETVSEISDDPSTWSKAQIIEVYKKSAKKSHKTAKSTQQVAIKDISVNNGEYKGLFDFIMPIMSKLLANNTSDKDGITGGYDKLVEADVASAKAYKSGNCIAIEMVMHKQTSGPRDDALSGSVGHAITAVGDIGVVVTQLTDLGLPLELSEKDTAIYYTNPTVKVLIDADGKIVNGTWRYTVDIRLNNYKAFGKKVETTSVVMDNTIMVNGGFKK